MFWTVQQRQGRQGIELKVKRIYSIRFGLQNKDNLVRALNQREKDVLCNVFRIAKYRHCGKGIELKGKEISYNMCFRSQDECGCCTDGGERYCIVYVSDCQNKGTVI